MSWAEFEIRIISMTKHIENQKTWDQLMIREISYEVHKLSYLFGKKRPPSKNKFWSIGKDKVKKAVSEQQKAAFIKQHEEYLKQKNV